MGITNEEFKQGGSTSNLYFMEQATVFGQNNSRTLHDVKKIKSAL